MQLIVAAGGGERDYAVDGQILTGLAKADNPGVFLNERLMGDLRPTLFLAQLSNLLAGNISIVHGVTGASRTFMGEESSGVDAIRIAHERIASGQDEIFLVGGAYNAERPDVLLIYEMGGFLWKKPYRPGLGAPGGGRRHDPRHRAPASWCSNPASMPPRAARSRSRPSRASPPTAPAARPGSVEAALHALSKQLGAKPDVVLSGATGVKGITDEEQAALKRHRAEGAPACHRRSRRPHDGGAGAPRAWRSPQG